MNLRRPNADDSTGTFNRSKDVAPVFGLYSRCIDDVEAVAKFGYRHLEAVNCFTWIFRRNKRLRGQKLPCGLFTSENSRNARGAKGLPEGVEGGPDTTFFLKVDTETECGGNKKVKLRVPIFTIVLGSTVSYTPRFPSTATVLAKSLLPTWNLRISSVKE